MSVFGIRRKFKSGMKKALGMEEGPSDTAAPNWQNRPASPAPSIEEEAAVQQAEATGVPEIPVAVSEPAIESDPAELVAEAVEPEPASVEAEVSSDDEGEVTENISLTTMSADDVVGPPLTLEAVQEILDDMVRPALQGDGGDISLLKIEDNDIYVKLVGACTTCPSSIMTMKMGVEALLREEFPSLRELIQVDGQLS
jgi:Fe-S cluster biogenesis protein NfuA